MERAAEVDRHHGRPGLRGILPGFYVRPGNAGIVDEDVDASERRHGLVARRLDLGEAGYVDGEGSDEPACLELGRRCLRKLAIAVPDRDGGPGVQQALRNRASDSLGTAGDSREFSREIDLVGQECLPVFESRKATEPT